MKRFQVQQLYTIQLNGKAFLILKGFDEDYQRFNDYVGYEEIMLSVDKIECVQSNSWKRNNVWLKYNGITYLFGGISSIELINEIEKLGKVLG